MPALKYSRQREAIKSFLMTRKDHPTADVVYHSLRADFPNISLGTVYRNLTLLADLGEIARLRLGDGVDHFDADTSRHYHFICSECGSVLDLHTEFPDSFDSRDIRGWKPDRRTCSVFSGDLPLLFKQTAQLIFHNKSDNETHCHE